MSGTKRRLLALPILTMLIATLGFQMPSGSPAKKPQSNNKTPAAYDFTLRSLQRGNIRLAEFRGQPIVVHFTAPWCATCQKQLDKIITAIETTKNDNPHNGNPKNRGQEINPVTATNIFVIAMASEGGIRPEAIKNTQRQTGLFNTYLLLDPTNRVSAHYLIDTLPTTLLLNHDGDVVKRLEASGGLSDGDASIDEFLTEYKAIHTRFPLQSLYDPNDSIELDNQTDLNSPQSNDFDSGRIE